MSAPAPRQDRALPTVRTVSDLRAVVGGWQRAGERVALVPTMGALHRGHLALVERGRALCPRVVASLFVNPTQFGPNEDFSRYPRDEAADAALLAGAGCDLLYAPSVAEIYPPGFAVTVTPGPIAERQCGPFRPGHFAGVATVVSKLLLQSQVDVALFGEKDFQQLQVIRRVARDLDIPVAIEGVRTVRDSDGLALSSRNVYLTPEQRAVAPALYRTLQEMARRLEAGDDAAAVSADGLAALSRAGVSSIDYLEVADAETLAPLASLDRPGRILSAVWLGKTRLIDNIAVARRR
ncbi:MAG TPA: pantoate--beta-alanine ligase [Stellaceae bacterium]|jgi:pantoate--beta-alanine ligase|nr:pantoate--beta-alanine ligase [Stellaceae bacterium]